VINPKGRAEVKSSLAGDYSVTLEDYKPKATNILKS
jgi:hypothetical protein